MNRIPCPFSARKIVLCVTALLPGLLAAAPFLSEAQLQNGGTIRDEDGEAVDWVEIHNPDSTPARLTGWKLVEGSTPAWAFPEMSIEPGGYLVVFASGKDRTESGSALHTNFKLKEGETLQLLSPEGDIISTLELPAQAPDGTSYGVTDEAAETVLIGDSSPCRWSWSQSAGSSTATPGWTLPAFADRKWTPGVNRLLFSRQTGGFLVSRWSLQSVPETPDEIPEIVSAGGAVREGSTVLPAVNLSSGPGGKLHFTGDKPFPSFSQTPAPGNYLYQAEGSIVLPAAGKWTFAVNSPESLPLYSLKVGNNEAGSESGGGIIVRPVDLPPIDWPGGGPERLHTFEFPAAGTYPVTLWWRLPEGESEKGLEFSVARGEALEYGPAFRLAGQRPHTVTCSAEVPQNLPQGLRVTGERPAGANALLFRCPFTVTPAVLHQPLRLRIKYADGFRAWIDGRLVAQRHAPAGAAFATGMRSREDWNDSEEINLALSLSDFPQSGSHVLAVEVLRAANPHTAGYLQAGLVARAVDRAAPAVFKHFARPTPGQPNAPGFGPPALEPDISPGRGVYPGPVTFSLHSAESGAKIYYSTDGSAPVPGQATLYRGPVTIDRTAVVRAVAGVPGRLPSHAILHTFILTSNQTSQSGAGLPEKWGDATADYDFFPGAVSADAAGIAAALGQLPSLSLSLSGAKLFGPNGLHAKPERRGRRSGAEASVEWLFPSGEGSFRENGELRIKGDASRSTSFLKHGFRLDFRGPELNHPVLADSTRRSFNTLMLHGSFVDNVMTLGTKAQYIRDLWVRDTLRKMGQPAPYGDYCHLYLNGLYWGLYHTGERPDAKWCAHYLGGSTGDWDVTESDGPVEGSNEGWDELFSVIRKESPTEDDYATVSGRFDLPGFADYMLANLYAANTDWPSHNWYAARDRRTGVWRFITWDAEFSFDRPGANQLPEPEFNLGGDPGDLLRFLTRFRPFRAIFADRVRLHFYNGGPLSPAGAEATWMNRSGQIEAAVKAEYARWGDKGMVWGGGESPAVTYADWQAELTRLRRDWFPHRTRTFLRQLRAAGLFPDTLAPAIHPADGWLDGTGLASITNTGSQAALYYTLDGTDPQGDDGRPSATAIPYTGPLALTPPVTVKARAFGTEDVSALTVVTFHSGPDPRGLKFSEISYRPENGGEEFVEIVNRGPAPLPLEGVRVADAVRFQFPAGFILPAGGTAVLVRDAAAFAAAFPGVTVAGEYRGALDDDGETITLQHPTAGELDRVAFRPFFPWPGNARSLQRRSFDTTNSAGWLAGDASPGTAPSRPVLAAAPLPLSEPDSGFFLKAGPLDPARRQLPLTFPVEPGCRYEIEWTADLSQPWQLLKTVPASSLLTTDVPASTPNAFYRVRKVTPAP